jgi:hypothetical protein
MSPASDFQPLTLSPEERAKLNKRWCVVDWLALVGFFATVAAFVLEGML